MHDMVKDLKDFHRMMALPDMPVPKIPSPRRVELRRKLIDEETNKELLVAIDNEDMPGIADGIADAIYVAIGAALEYGIPIGAVWDLVHAKNMDKIDPVTGKILLREDGKIMKPPHWTPPDIAALLRAYGWQG